MHKLIDFCRFWMFDIHFISNKQNSIRSTKNLYLLEAARCEIDRSDRE